VFLGCLGCHAGRDGDGLLGAAGGGLVWRGEDLGPLPVQGHGRGAERAAGLPRGGGAGDPVVAVSVVSGKFPEFVTGCFGGLLVVRRDLVRGGVAGERA
jgi:hypothetical protein